MKDSKLFVLLRTLSADEMRWLNKFVKSPFHNSNQHVVHLYELLRKHHPELPHPKLSKEALFKKLFPKASFDIQRLRLVMHRLAKQVEAFLVAMRLREQSFEQDKLLVAELSRRNTFELFQKKTKELLQQLEEKPFRDRQYYKHREELYLQWYRHPVTNKQAVGMGTLYMAMDNLDAYFSLSKIQLSAALQERAKTLAEEYEVRYFEEVRAIGQTSFESPNLLFLLYSSLIKLQMAPDDHALYEKVAGLFLKVLPRIRKVEKQDILRILINFTSRQLNRGNEDYLIKTFNWYRTGLDANFLLFNNELTENTFSNIVKLGGHCQEFEWTEKFIHDYEGYLDEQIRKDAVTISLGALRFSQKDYFKTVELLANHRFQKTYQFLSAKTLILRSYLELYTVDNSYFDLLVAQTNNFEKYIRNNKSISPSKAEAYLSFAKFIRKIAKTKFETKKKERLAAQIMETKNLMLKRWLIRKIK